MGGAFNFDSPFWHFMGRVADMIFLNLVFILCCIPIFTIGASVTALNYVTLKIRDGNEGYVVRSFFRSFRQNFRQATLIWLLLLLLGVILVADWLILRDGTGAFVILLRVVDLLCMAVFLMIYVYVFAVLSRFENTIFNTLKNSLFMSIADFPRTLLMIVILVGSAVITFLTASTVFWGILVWFLLGFSLIAYWNCSILYKIFEKYTPEDVSAKGEDF